MPPYLAPEHRDLQTHDAAPLTDRGAEVTPVPASARPDIAQLVADDRAHTDALRRRLEQVIAAGDLKAEAAGGLPESDKPPQVDVEAMMTDPDSTAFMMNHDGHINLYWNGNDGPHITRLGTHNFEKQHRPKFTDEGAPHSLDVDWLLPLSRPLPKTDFTEDSHGNFVSVEHAVDASGTRVTVKAEPQPVYIDEKMSKPYHLSLDLTRYGGPHLRNYAEGWAIPTFARTGPGNAYRLHATAKDEERLERLALPHAERLGTAIAGVESLFGLQPGETVKHLLVTDTKVFNAYAINNGTKRLDTIVLLGSVLEMGYAKEVGGDVIQMDEDKLDDLIRHETTHRVDEELELSEHLATVLDTMPDGLLDKLAEHSFFPGNFGGHPHTSKTEALATIFTDLISRRFIAQTQTDRWPTEALANLDALIDKLKLTFAADVKFKRMPMLHLLERRQQELRAAHPGLGEEHGR